MGKVPLITKYAIFLTLWGQYYCSQLFYYSNKLHDLVLVTAGYLSGNLAPATGDNTVLIIYSPTD